MNRLSVVVLVLGSMCQCGATHAQPGLPPPAFDRAQNFAMAIQEDAKLTASRADARWQQSRFVQVIEEYESFIGRAQSVPEATMNHSVMMLLAGAHLEIALGRVSMPEFQNPSFRDQYRKLANIHLNQTLELLRSTVAAAAAAGQSEAEKQNFLCGLFLRLAGTVALRGIVNNVADDLETGIRNYETSAPCNEDSKSTVQYLRGLKRNMTGSPFGSDAIVAFTAKLTRSSGTPGKFIAPFIEASYDFYQKRQPPLHDRLQR